MGALPIPEPTGLRYAPYIQELREFFAFSGLRCGSLDDVFAIVERIQTSPPFAEDVSSLVRATVLREGGSMPHGQLLEILALAIGGVEMEDAPLTHRESLRQLLAFIAGVLRRPWNVPPGERAEVLPFPSEASEATAFEPSPRAPQPPPPMLQIRFEGPDLPAPAPPNRLPMQRPMVSAAIERSTQMAAVSAPGPESAPAPQPDLVAPLPSNSIAAAQPQVVAATAVEPAAVAIIQPAPVAAKAVEAAATVVTVAQAEPVAAIPASTRPPVAPHPYHDEDDDEPASPPWMASRSLRPEPHPAKSPITQSVPPKSPLTEAPPPPEEPARPQRKSWLSRLSPSMREVVIAGACAVMVAVLVAAALRPGSSLPSETITRPAPYPSSSPSVGTPAPAATPIAAAPVQAAPPAAQAAKPSSYGEAFLPAPAASRKSSSGNSNAEYIAPPTVHYYNGWTPANQPAAKQSSPAVASAAVTAPASSSGAAVRTASAEFNSPSPSPAPVERRPVSSFTTRAGASSGSYYSTVSSGTMAANLVSAPLPDYPMLAKIAHIDGKVILQAVIARDGSVSATHVLSGHRVLRGAAVDAVRHWRYRPYVVDGRPIDVATIVTVDFRNHNDRD